MSETSNPQDIITFIVTVDTRADNEWQRERGLTHHNVRALPAQVKLAAWANLSN
ncbi:MAG: hypothetical protein KAW89_08785 [Armatimonadetes bacterium]|nr:hypothetical protein [Armatimonadota bacterium]